MRSMRSASVWVCAAVGAVAFLYSHPARAALVFSDGFGDGDRDNNGLDTGATATTPSDVGIPWLLTDGTSAVSFTTVDDSAGIGTGNALQLNNTGANNRPAVGHFSAIALADGDKLTLTFDLRVPSVSLTGTDRGIRFGLYHDTNGDDGSVDHGSTSSVSVDDVGYNARVDTGTDPGTNSTTLDVTRDDTATGTSIIQATTTGLSVSSTNIANSISDTSKHHFELDLTRSGTGMLVSLQEDGNAAISGTDATPTGFTFDEVAIGVRSTAAYDTRWDNFSLTYTAAVPEPTALGMITVLSAGLLGRRRRK